MRSLRMGRGDWWWVWIRRKRGRSKGALADKARMAMWQEGRLGQGGWSEPRAVCAKGCSGGSKGPTLPPPPKGIERFGLHQIPFCQVALFLVIILCGLMQILRVGNMCIGPSFWFHMIKLFDTKLSTIAFLIKHIVHMIPFWFVLFSFVKKWRVCVCVSA